jgi:hypothetical protein
MKEVNNQTIFIYKNTADSVVKLTINILPHKTLLYLVKKLLTHFLFRFYVFYS